MLARRRGMRTQAPPRVRGRALCLVLLLAFVPSPPDSSWACPGNPPPGIPITDQGAGALGVCLCKLIDCAEGILPADMVQAAKDAKAAGCVRIGDTADIAEAIRLDRVQECINDQIKKSMDTTAYLALVAKCEKETKAPNATGTVAVAAHTSLCIMFNKDKIKHPDPTKPPGTKKGIVFEEIIHIANDHVPQHIIPSPQGSSADVYNVRAMREHYKEIRAASRLIAVWKKYFPKQIVHLQTLFANLDHHVDYFCKVFDALNWSNGSGVSSSDSALLADMNRYLACKHSAWCELLDAIDQGDYHAKSPNGRMPHQTGYNPEPRSGDAIDKALWVKKMEGLGYDVQ